MKDYFQEALALLVELCRLEQEQVNQQKRERTGPKIIIVRERDAPGFMQECQGIGIHAGQKANA